MRIHGTFLNSSGLAVTVEIITRRDTLTSIEIGSDEAGLWFPASEAFTTESGLNDTFDVVLQSSATLRLETTDYRAEFYQRACRDAVVTVSVTEDDGTTRTRFLGCVEPRQYAQDFSGGQLSNDIELPLIDALSSLQYASYAHIGAPGVSFQKVREASSVRSFLSIIKDLLSETPCADLPYRLYYDGSKALASAVSRRFSILSEVGVAETVFIGEDEDDTMTMLETLEHMLRFLNLHIVQQGLDFFVFSWESLRQPSIQWRCLIGGAPDFTQQLSPQALSVGNVFGTRMDIEMGETYNRLVLDVKPADTTDVVASPLSSDALVPMFTGKQLYATCLWAAGTGDTSSKAFQALLNDQPTTYDGAHTVEYFLWAKSAIGWRIGTGDGRGGVRQWTGTKQDQQRIPGLLRKQIGAAILSMGKIDRKASATDNSPTSTVEMADYLVVSVNGNLIDDEATTYPQPDDLRRAAPVATWDGNAAGGIYSPSDDETKNYIVISGSIILNPVLRQSVNYLNRAQYDPVRWVKGRDGERRLSMRWWRADTPKSQPQPQEATSDYGAVSTQPVKSDNPLAKPYLNAWEGFYPWTDDDAQDLAFSYSRVGSSVDNVSKIGALECMLRVGDKVAVEDKDFDEDGNRTVTIDGEEVVVRYGHINNISWKPFRTLEQCRAAHPGDEDAALDEYYTQTITIGFDPKIGDKIIGTQFDIQNNIDYTLGLDVKGMAIPVRHSDHLRGRVHFEILGPVFNAQFDKITRRHRTFFRKEKWTATTVPILSRVSSIMVRDLKIELHSDNGMAGADTDSEHSFMSDTDEDFVNKKDDLEMRIHSALTTSECEELGCANTVAPSVAVDLTTGDAVLRIFDWLKAAPDAVPPIAVKAERDYIDSYYQEYHVPRIELSFDFDGLLPSPFARFTHPALDGRTFSVISVGYDFQTATSQVRMKEE